MWSSYIFSLIPTLVYPGQGLGNKGIILFRFILLHAYITVKVKVNYLFQSVGLSVGSSVSATNDGGLVGARSSAKRTSNWKRGYEQETVKIFKRPDEGSPLIITYCLQ